MDPLEAIVAVLFAVFLIGSVIRILAMLERKKVGEPLERSRVVFFFTACLMLVCLIPLRLFELASTPVVLSDLVVVIVNFIGYALTYNLDRRSAAAEEEGVGRLLRTYQVYLQGVPFGQVTKEGFDVLLEMGLLKRQRTLELIDDYKKQARDQGISIQLLRSRDGSQTLIQVEAPESDEAAGEDEN